MLLDSLRFKQSLKKEHFPFTDFAISITKGLKTKRENSICRGTETNEITRSILLRIETEKWGPAKKRKYRNEIYNVFSTRN